MKVKILAAIVVISLSSISSVVATGPGTTGVESLALVLISSQWQEGEAEALCLASSIEEPLASFCYYVFGDSEPWHDHKDGFNEKKLVIWDGGYAHEQWVSLDGLYIDMEGAFPALREVLDEVRVSKGYFREHAESLGARVVDLSSVPKNSRPLGKAGFALSVHRQMPVVFAVSESIRSEKELKDAEEKISRLESDRVSLQGEMEVLRERIKGLEAELERVRQQEGEASSSVLRSMDGFQRITLAIAIACALLVSGVLVFNAWNRKRNPVSQGLDLPKVPPAGYQRKSGGIGALIERILSLTHRVKSQSVRRDLLKACGEIKDAYQVLLSAGGEQDDRVFRALQDGLSQEALHGEDLPALARQLIGFLTELRGRLGRIVGSEGSNESLRHQVQLIENYLRRIQTSFGGEASVQPWTFADLLAAWNSLNGDHRELRRELATVSGVALGNLNPGAEGQSATFERLRSAMAVRKCLREFRPHEEVAGVADHLVRVGSLISGRCRLSSGDSARIPDEVQRIFDRLERLARDHFDQGVLWEPVDIIDLAEDRLKKLRREGEKLRTEAAEVERAIDGLGRGHLLVDQYSSLDKLQRVASEISELKREITRLKEAGRHNADRANELATVEALLASRLGNDGPARDQIRRLFDDRDTGLELLQDYRPGGTVSVRATAHAVVQHLEKARESVQRVLPEATGRIDVLAEEIATSHERLTAASKGISELCRHFSEYLTFDWREFSSGDDVRGYIEVLKRELASEHRPLRLGLSAALVAWKSVRDKLGSLPRGQQIALGLRLPSLQLGLEQISERLQHLPMEELWVKGLRPGFSRGWMHDLFRAELLFECFYARDSKHQDLGDALALATGTLRSVMHRLGKGIEGVVLLEDFPIDRPSGWAEPRHLADQELRTLPEVNRRVCDLLDDNRSNFIVDVESFRLCGDNEHSGECRVIVVNPAEWLQAQEASDGIS